MDNELKQIGLRLKGLRDSLNMSIADFATSCNIPTEDITLYETGEKDLSINLLKRIATKYGIDLSTLMFGDEPRMNSYFLTKKGQGKAVKRVENYKYEALAAGFNNRKADIFIVEVEPTHENIEIHESSHPGQEFNLVLKGKMLLQISGKDIILNEGDSLYYDSSLCHGMKALDKKKVESLAIIL